MKVPGFQIMFQKWQKFLKIIPFQFFKIKATKRTYPENINLLVPKMVF